MIKYIESIHVNGKLHERLWIQHEVLAAGAHLVFTLVRNQTPAYA